MFADGLRAISPAGFGITPTGLVKSTDNSFHSQATPSGTTPNPSWCGPSTGQSVPFPADVTFCVGVNAQSLPALLNFSRSKMKSIMIVMICFHEVLHIRTYVCLSNLILSASLFQQVCKHILHHFTEFSTTICDHIQVQVPFSS